MDMAESKQVVLRGDNVRLERRREVECGVKVFSYRLGVQEVERRRGLGSARQRSRR